MGAFRSEDIAAFWLRVDRSGGPHACWEWMGSRNTRTGHGYLTLGPRQQFAHRLALELSGRNIPFGMLVLHSCGNACCCNPAHLEVGSRADMMTRRAEARRALQEVS